ncbi:MAG TPA: hypothetical protein VHY91_26405 [Pirellulales bacterium]|jgi:hypothetical protein|nr:hypothetical protein [Pirellulales bacterium]
MKTIRDVGSYIWAEPFRPFRIKMVDGTVYEIAYPDTACVGRSSASIYGVFGQDDHERWHHLPLALIEPMEPSGG